MASKYWLKLYHEMLDDPKVMTLRPALRWRFIETLLVAGEMDEAGYLPPVDKYAWRVRDNVEIVESQFAELADAGLLSKDNGCWLVTKFAERQAPVSAAERMRRMRERKQKQEYYGGETEELQDSDEDVTIRNADKDTDKDKDEIARDGDSNFAEACAAYEDNIGMLSPIISEKIMAAVDEYPDGWVVDAISIAAQANKRNLRYIKGILRNWHQKGYQDTGKNGHSPYAEEVTDESGGYNI